VIDERTPHSIVGDITRLRQVLVNLISNAVKFTQKGEVILSVNAAAIPNDRFEIHFSVADTGIGIPEDKIGLLFRSFSQVDSSATKHYGGTGLGLAISKLLSEMMGGRMWVESIPDIGSTFTLR
jgi:signal transduction histidine kinase